MSARAFLEQWLRPELLDPSVTEVTRTSLEGGRAAVLLEGSGHTRRGCGPLRRRADHRASVLAFLIMLDGGHLGGAVDIDRSLCEPHQSGIDVSVIFRTPGAPELYGAFGYVPPRSEVVRGQFADGTELQAPAIGGKLLLIRSGGAPLAYLRAYDPGARLIASRDVPVPPRW